MPPWYRRRTPAPYQPKKLETTRHVTSRVTYKCRFGGIDGGSEGHKKVDVRTVKGRVSEITLRQSPVSTQLYTLRSSTSNER